MKKSVLLLMTLCLCFGVFAQECCIKPSGVFLVPNISRAEYERVYDDIDSGKISIAEMEKIYKSPIFRHLYSPTCSWYCSGTINSVKTSSSLKSQDQKRYGVENIHDFNHESVWAEGVSGYGIGEYIIYEFPGNCPKITTINILNGYVKNDRLWRANARVKRLKVYYNDVPYAILELEDSRSLQWFDIGEVGREKDDACAWTLKFEILEVYPGTRYEDTVISELYFDGIHTH
jgi:hypothetical protein